MSRRIERQTVDPDEFDRWRERAARHLRATITDDPRRVRDMELLAVEVDGCRSPLDVLGLEGLPIWVAAEAKALLEDES